MKKIYRFLLFLILLPAVLHIILLVISRIPANNRRYEATLNRVGWHINMEEQNSDSLLHFNFYYTRKSPSDSLSFLIQNKYSNDVVSFVLREGIDTVYIRKGCEFKDLFPPEEQELHKVAPKDFYIDNPQIGTLPSKCKLVSFSDTRFFIYDKNKGTYIPKDDTTHIITLYHNTEKEDSYSLWDVTASDTLEICIKRSSINY